MDKFQKYAELQKTVWKKWENTTLGNLPAEQFEKIDSEYEKMIAGPSTVNTEVAVVENESAEKVGSDESQGRPIADGTTADDIGKSTDAETADSADQVLTTEMADTETGFDDDAKAGE